jgi:hypothetical protein
MEKKIHLSQKKMGSKAFSSSHNKKHAMSTKIYPNQLHRRERKPCLESKEYDLGL